MTPLRSAETLGSFTPPYKISWGPDHERPRRFFQELAAISATIAAEWIPDTEEAKDALRALVRLAAEHIGGYGDHDNNKEDWHRRLELVRRMVREYADENASDLFIQLDVEA